MAIQIPNAFLKPAWFHHYSLRRAASSYALHLQSFLEDKKVASVIPTSLGAAETICQHIDFSKTDKIIELGAGTGSISNALLRKMKPDAQLMTFETNRALFRNFKRSIRDSRVTALLDSAFSMQPGNEKYKADVVVSGIPLSFYSPRETSLLIQNILACIKGNGVFICYQAWLPPFCTARDTRKTIRTCFNETDVTTVYKNIPPLIVITARPRMGLS